jgi:hypothetical protein
MKRGITSGTMVALAVAAGFGVASARSDEQPDPLKSVLHQDFALGKARTPGTQHFDVTTTFTTLGPDGRRGEAETLHLELRRVSPGDPDNASEQCTCGRFEYVRLDGARVTVPALEGWTYAFKRTKTGCDEQGQVFGIDHRKFQHLKDSNGVLLGPDKAYLIYNTFIDFHAFCDEFVLPVAEGRGIQHLTRIGQKIVHAAAHTTPPTDLAGSFKSGSYFKNGEITLTLKGLSIVDEAPCAVVECDSGAASFEMLMEPMPGMEVRSVGGSHYWGDIHVDLATRWPRIVLLHELIVSETKVPMPGREQPTAVHAIQERQTTIRLVTKETHAAE